MKAAAGLPFFVLTKVQQILQTQRYKQTRAERKGPTVYGDNNQIRYIKMIIIQKSKLQNKIR